MLKQNDSMIQLNIVEDDKGLPEGGAVKLGQTLGMSCWCIQGNNT